MCHVLAKRGSPMHQDTALNINKQVCQACGHANPSKRVFPYLPLPGTSMECGPPASYALFVPRRINCLPIENLLSWELSLYSCKAISREQPEPTTHLDTIYGRRKADTSLENLSPLTCHENSQNPGTLCQASQLSMKGCWLQSCRAPDQACRLKQDGRRCTLMWSQRVMHKGPHRG